MNAFLMTCSNLSYIFCNLRPTMGLYITLVVIIAVHLGLWITLNVRGNRQ